MNREIKFRAWDVIARRMLKGDNLMLSMRGGLFWQFGADETKWVDPKDFHIMQYTGLKDKNWVELYENDLLQHPEGEVLEIVWDQIMCKFRGKYPDYPMMYSFMLQMGDLGQAVLVGNRFENPELLEAKE